MTPSRELSELGVREYHADDQDACLAIFDTNVPEYFRAEERDEFRSFLSSLPGPYLVVVDTDTVVVACGGYATNDGGVVDLCWGMVRRDLHGAGIGRMLTEGRLERARDDTGVVTVALSTSQLTTEFYARLGFRVVNVVLDGYGPGLDRCDMRLDMSVDT